MEPKLNLVLINEYIKNTRLPKEVYSDLVMQKVSATDKQPVADFPHFSPLILALVAASHLLSETEVTLSIRNGSVIVSYYGVTGTASTIVVNNQVITMECDGGQKYAVEADRSKYATTVLPTLLEKVAESDWDTATRARWTHYLVCAQNLLDPLNPLRLMDVIDICRDRRCNQVHELNMLELELVETNEYYDSKDSVVAQLEEKRLADEATRKNQSNSELTANNQIMQTIKTETAMMVESTFNKFHEACGILAAQHPHNVLFKSLSPQRFEIWDNSPTPALSFGFMSHVNALGSAVNCYYVNYADGGDSFLNEIPGITYPDFAKDLISKLDALLDTEIKNRKETTAICQFILNALALEAKDDANVPEVTNLEDAVGEAEDPLPKKIFKELREEVLLYMKRFKPERIQYVPSEDEQEFELVYSDADTVIAMGFACHWDSLGTGNVYWISRKDGSDFNVHDLNYDDYDSLRDGLLTLVREAEFHGYSPEQNKGLKQICDFLFLTLNK